MADLMEALLGNAAKTGDEQIIGPVEVGTGWR